MKIQSSENSLLIIYKYLCILLITLVISFFSANRSDDISPRNDTYGYKIHYECSIVHDFFSDCRKKIGSSKLEYGYSLFTSIFGKLFGNNSFWFYKLVVALIINITIVTLVFLLSNKSVFPVILLLLDYRFYAYSSNILRHGLALSIMLVSLYAYIHRYKIKSFTLTILALLFHNSSFVLSLKIRKKINFIVLLFLISGAVIVNIYLPSFIASNKAMLLVLNEKIVSYSNTYGNSSILFPIHYWYVFVVGLFVYFKTRNEQYICIFNILISLIIFTILFSAIGVGDRILAFMPPFIYIIMYWIYVYFVNFLSHLSRPLLFLGYFFALMALMSYVFYLNWRMIVIHFNF